MKVTLVLGLLFAFSMSFTSHAISAQERAESSIVQQKDSALKVDIVPSKRSYKRSEKIAMRVMLTNSGKDALYVLGTLEWGYNASFILHVRDASGKEIEPQGFPDDQTYVARDDPSAFVKLLPQHFLGTNFVSALKFLNLSRPGRYAIFVEYHAPISTSFTKLSPFWGRENGTIKSNTVWIEVL